MTKVTKVRKATESNKVAKVEKKRELTSLKKAFKKSQKVYINKEKITPRTMKGERLPYILKSSTYLKIFKFLKDNKGWEFTCRDIWESIEGVDNLHTIQMYMWHAISAGAPNLYKRKVKGTYTHYGYIKD